MNTRNYRTAKGTELPILNLRGKEYLKVKYRLVWFREDHPDWSIETELMSVTDVSAYARATIRDEAGRIIATSHKFERIKGFPDFIEKAETGAIGRALALIGYGTQFCADELDEGPRIVDAPAVVPRHSQLRPQVTANKSQKPKQVFVKGQTDESLNETLDHVASQLNLAKPEATESVDVAKEEEAHKPTWNPGEYTINFGRKYKGRKLKEIPKAEVESYIQWLESSSLKPGTTLSQHLQFLKNAFHKFYDAKVPAH